MTRVLPFIALALLVLVAIIPSPGTAENSRYWLAVFDYPGIAFQVEVDNGSIYVAGVRSDTWQGFLVRLNSSGYPERTLFFGGKVDTVAFALGTDYIYLVWTDTTSYMVLAKLSKDDFSVVGTVAFNRPSNTNWISTFYAKISGVRLHSNNVLMLYNYPVTNVETAGVLYYKPKTYIISRDTLTPKNSTNYFIIPYGDVVLGITISGAFTTSVVFYPLNSTYGTDVVRTYSAVTNELSIDGIIWDGVHFITHSLAVYGIKNTSIGVLSDTGKHKVFFAPDRNTYLTVLTTYVALNGTVPLSVREHEYGFIYCGYIGIGGNYYPFVSVSSDYIVGRGIPYIDQENGAIFRWIKGDLGDSFAITPVATQLLDESMVPGAAPATVDYSPPFSINTTQLLYYAVAIIPNLGGEAEEAPTTIVIAVLASATAVMILKVIGKHCF